jgi:hypothetical protein
MMFLQRFSAWTWCFFAIGIIVLLAGCGAAPAAPRAAAASYATTIPSPAVSAPRAPAVPQTPNSRPLPEYVQNARAHAITDLANRLGVPAAEIEVLSVQQAYKPDDRSDSPGRLNGWIMRLGAHGNVFSYRVDMHGTFQALPQDSQSR